MKLTLKLKVKPKEKEEEKDEKKCSLKFTISKSQLSSPASSTLTTENPGDQHAKFISLVSKFPEIMKLKVVRKRRSKNFSISDCQKSISSRMHEPSASGSVSSCLSSDCGTITYGGYSNLMVADEHFIIRWPDNFPLDAGAPLLCAGITTYSPLRYFGLDKPGMHVGVVGLGGLGHVAVKFAKAFGAKVTVISTSENKKKEAIEKLGADAFLVSRDPAQMEAAVGTLDGIIDTVSAVHPIIPLISLLKPHGKMIMVGAPEKPLEVATFSLILGRKTLSGSAIGGLKETQEMIDFAAKNNILADVEIIPMDYVNKAMERLLKADVKYRFVIDMSSLKSA